MSILAQQLYGGVLNTDASTEPMRAERKPFGNLSSKEGVESPLFSGFTYAVDTEAAGAFGNGAESVKNSPTDIRTAEDTITFFNTTTYGTPDNFARLGKGQSTVLTNLARFVKNGDSSETATTWNNTEMKNSFVQDGGGTRNQLARTEYTNDTGWKNELKGPNRNGFDAGHKYEVQNVHIDQIVATAVNSETGEEIPLSDSNQDGSIFDDFFGLMDEMAADFEAASA